MGEGGQPMSPELWPNNSTVYNVFQLNLSAKSDFLVSKCSLGCVESQNCRCHFFRTLLVKIFKMASKMGDHHTIMVIF